MGNWKIVTNGSTKDLQTDYGFRVQYNPGLGMTDVDNLITDFGILDGGLLTRQRVAPREFSLVGWISGSSVTDLHTTRKNLQNLLKPGRSGSQEPVILQYTGATCTVQASAFYRSGLGLGQSFSVYDEIDVNIGFQMPDPFLEAPTSTSQSLAVTSTVTNINRIFQRDLTTGCWSSMASGVNDTVDAIITTKDGATMYVGGTFTTAGSSGTTACRIAKYTISNSTWASLSRGVGNDPADEVYTLAMAPNGVSLYAGGIFDRAGSSGTTACRIAQCNTSTCAWSSLGHANACVLAIAVDSDGTIYAGGGFNVIGGVAASHIAKRDPSSSAWSAMSVGASLGLWRDNSNQGAFAESIAIGLDGSVYVAGDFSHAGGVACKGVARWSPTTGCWYALGAGFGSFTIGNHPRGLSVGPDGTLYAVGGFSEAGGLTASRAAYWNGAGWKRMGDGFNATAHEVKAANDGSTYAVGAFSTAGGIATPDGVARWRGSWQSGGIDLSGTQELAAINVDAINNKLTFGILGGTANLSASTAAVTVVNTGGTADSYPILSCSGPGRIYEFRNFTTGEEIYFDIVLNQGETATLDLRPGKKTFTTDFRGSVISKVLPGSNISTFRLLSGSNAISLFISGCTASASAKLSWTPRYWGIDS